MKLIDKAAVVAEIEDWRDKIKKGIFSIPLSGREKADATFEYELLGKVISFLDTLEVKEVDLESEQRMRECPYRQIGCTMYENKILECNGACSWVVDYLNLKRRKGNSYDKGRSNKVPTTTLP